MNIFAVDSNPERAARALCDKHVVKMAVESAQILSTAQRLSGSADARLYRATHRRHPCVLWTLESTANYNWLYRHYLALCAEYSRRYGRVHASLRLAPALARAPARLPRKKRTAFAQAMPCAYRCNDAVEAYRAFYRGEKKRFARWTKRAKPAWF